MHRINDDAVGFLYNFLNHRGYFAGWTSAIYSWSLILPLLLYWQHTNTPIIFCCTARITSVEPIRLHGQWWQRKVVGTGGREASWDQYNGGGIRRLLSATQRLAQVCGKLILTTRSFSAIDLRWSECGCLLWICPEEAFIMFCRLIFDVIGKPELADQVRRKN